MRSQQLLPWLLAIVIFTSVLFFHVWFLDAFQLSTAVTGNGVWKALSFTEYKKGTMGLERGNVLYYPALKLASNILGYHTAEGHYRTIILFNGFFNAILLTSVLLWVKHTFKRYSVAIAAVLLHAFIPAYFMLSSSNEDIYPAYTFFVLGFFAFHYYNQTKQQKWLALTSALWAFSMLFHWTAGVPAFGALFVFLLFLEPVPLHNRIAKLAIVAIVVTAIFWPVSRLVDLPFMTLVFPAKGTNSLWVSGITLNKIPVVIYNTFIFLGVGSTIKIFNVPLGAAFVSMALPLAWMLIAGFNIVRNYKSNRLSKGYQLSLLYLAVMFALGAGMNYYEQGSDAQFFIQPQFFFFFAFLVVVAKQLREHRVSVFLILLIVPSWLVCYGFVNHRKGIDGQHLHNVAVIEKVVKNPAKTLFIGRGFDKFNPFATMKWGGYQNYHFLHYPSGWPYELEMTDSAYLQQAKDSIESYVQNGYELIVIDFLNKDASYIGNSFIGFDLTTKIELIQQYLNENYHIRQIENTHTYTFYYLSPKKSDLM